MARKAKEARAAEERQRQQARKEAERKRAAEERAEAWNNCARDAFKFLFRALPLCLLAGYFAAGIALWAGGAGSGAVMTGMWMVLALWPCAAFYWICVGIVDDDSNIADHNAVGFCMLFLAYVVAGIVLWAGFAGSGEVMTGMWMVIGIPIICCLSCCYNWIVGDEYACN